MPIFKAKKKAPDLTGLSLEQLLYEADTRDDPKDVYAALRKAEELAPENLPVQRRLLMHGRLHERDPRRIDFSVIKCHLLHAFEHPETHNENELRAMAREIFDAPRLMRCLELALEKDAFLREYLRDLSREYIRVFIAPDHTHSPKLLGFSFKGSLPKQLARPAADILLNVLSSPFLNAQEADTLAKAFYGAFHEAMQGEVRELDRLVGAETYARLRA